jgi:hypothetical protein
MVEMELMAAAVAAVEMLHLEGVVETAVVVEMD